MNNPTNIKYSQNLVLTATLSGSITIVLCLVYTLLTVAGIIVRFWECSIGEASSGGNYFWNTLVSVFILREECPTTIPASVKIELTNEYTVFVLAAITLSISIVCLISATCLLFTIQDEGSRRYMNFAVSAYLASCIASLIVDLTTASHFGIDHTYLNSLMDLSEPGSLANYEIEVLRQGTFLLMTIALKGYVAPLLNLILLILLVVYWMDHRRNVKTGEHSIHKLGALTAFDQPRKPVDNWSAQPEINSPFARGPHVNNGFISDDDTYDRASRRQREPPRSDFNYSSRSFDRSDSWHHSQPNLSQSSRPFSYLEDIKRPVPTRPLPSPAAEPAAPWRRDPWSNTPAVPAPDYSPQPQRLKSALKPAYM